MCWEHWVSGACVSALRILLDCFSLWVSQKQWRDRWAVLNNIQTGSKNTCLFVTGVKDAPCVYDPGMRMPRVSGWHWAHGNEAFCGRDTHSGIWMWNYFVQWAAEACWVFCHKANPVRGAACCPLVTQKRVNNTQCYGLSHYDVIVESSEELSECKSYSFSVASRELTVFTYKALELAYFCHQSSL